VGSAPDPSAAARDVVAVAAVVARPPPILTREFVLLVAGHFLQALGYASMVLLPVYLAWLGATRTTIGVVMGTAAVGGLLSRPAVGWALDQVGRKPTLVTGTLVLGVGMGLVGLVTDLGPTIYVARFIMGAGVGALFTAYFAAAADVVPASRRTEGLALFGISGLVPLAVNPLAGELGLAPPDLRWFFPALGGVILLSLPALWILRETRLGGREPVRAAAALRALSARPLWPVWLATVVFSGLVDVALTFVTVTAEQRHVAHPTWFWLTYMAGAVGVRVGGGRIPDRLGAHNVVAPAVGAYGLAALVIAGAHSDAAFLGAGLLAGVGHGYAFPVLAGQLVARAPEHLRGSAMAVFTAIWEVMALVLPPIFGAVSDQYDDATMFALLAVCGAAGCALWAVFEHRCAPGEGRGIGTTADA
jgi:MFS family permease